MCGERAYAGIGDGKVCVCLRTKFLKHYCLKTMMHFYVPLESTTGVTRRVSLLGRDLENLYKGQS